MCPLKFSEIAGSPARIARRRSRVVTGTLLAFVAVTGLVCGGDEITNGDGNGDGGGITQITVSPATATLVSLGETTQLAAQALDVRNLPVAGASFTWTSSDTDVATVSGAGLVTAVANGTAEIAARSGSISGTATVTVEQTATQLGFLVHPTTGYTDVVIAPVVQVAVQDARGNTVPGATEQVTLTFASNPGSAILKGTSTVAAVAGVATFTDLSIGVAGSGYRLLAACPPLASATSDAFDVTALGWQAQASGSTDLLMAVWGSSVSDVFAVGTTDPASTGTILHYDGTGWSAQVTGLASAWLKGVWGSSASDVFATGGLLISGHVMQHYDGTSWSSQDLGADYNLQSLWGSSASDVFAVGTNGTILHYDGTTWSPQTSGTTLLLNDVWGKSASDVLVVGTNGTILHYNGTAWNPQISNTTEHLYSVWPSPAAEVFAVGINGTILHYDGTTWSPQASGTTKLLGAVWGSSASDVFAVGDGGTILHYDGTSWSVQISGTTADFRGLWGNSATDVFAVGQDGTILHYGPVP